jgi:hypothetical protein
MDPPQRHREEVAVGPQGGQDGVEHGPLGAADLAAALLANELDLINLHLGVAVAVGDQPPVRLLRVGQHHLLAEDLVRGLDALLVVGHQFLRAARVVVVEVHDRARELLQAGQAGRHAAAVAAEDVQVGGQRQRDPDAFLADAVRQVPEALVLGINGLVNLVVEGVRPNPVQRYLPRGVHGGGLAVVHVRNNLQVGCAPWTGPAGGGRCIKVGGPCAASAGLRRLVLEPASARPRASRPWASASSRSSTAGASVRRPGRV